MFNYVLASEGKITGYFTESDFGRVFTYEDNTDSHWVNPEQFPHRIHMVDGSFRIARVMKTVAKVIVDEDEYGCAVIETWKIKQHKKLK